MSERAQSEDLFRQAKPLSPDFYLRDTVEVARDLLNCLLIYETEAGLRAGRIAETEAYTQEEPASHAYRGKTARNAGLFGPPGHAYLYFTYGMHHCLNAVTSPDGYGSGVLIRALEPLHGWELMAAARGLTEKAFLFPEEKGRVRFARTLCGGPGKICQAYSLTLKQNGWDLTIPQNLWIAPPEPFCIAPKAEDIRATPRIGISQATDLLWRFTVRDDPYISRK